MRKLVLLLLCSLCAAQTLTPNIGLYVPGFNQQQWDIPLNQNFNLLDKYLSGGLRIPQISLSGYLKPGLVTVGSLPTAPFGAFVYVVDGANQFDCSIGGGTWLVECYWDTSAYAPFIGPPGATIAGPVRAKTCGGSAIMSINADGTETCAASATGGNGVIYSAPPGSAIAGNSSYQTLYSYTLPANTLSTTGGIGVECNFVVTSVVASLQITFGGQIVATIAQPFTTGLTTLHTQIFNNSATNAQWFNQEQFANNGAGTTNYWNKISGTTSVDTTASQNVVCQFNQAGAGTTTGKGIVVSRIAQ